VAAGEEVVAVALRLAPAQEAVSAQASEPLAMAVESARVRLPEPERRPALGRASAL
jgi:hypothetical protein